MKITWNLQEALDLVPLIEAIAPRFGCHVAITGGVLYKIGERKDLDLLFYRIRQTPQIDAAGLFKALSEELDLNKESGRGWVFKALYHGKKIDMFFPEEITVEGEPAYGEDLS